MLRVKGASTTDPTTAPMNVAMSKETRFVFGGGLELDSKAGVESTPGGSYGFVDSGILDQAVETRHGYRAVWVARVRNTLATRQGGQW